MTANILEFRPRPKPAQSKTMPQPKPYNCFEGIDNATPTGRADLVNHHLSRCIDEIAAHQLSLLDGYHHSLRNGRKSIMKPLRTWLRQDDQGDAFARRAEIALRGLMLMSNVEAEKLNADYKALRKRMRALASKAEKLPLCKHQSAIERRQTDEELIDEARRLLFEAVRLLHRALNVCGSEWSIKASGRAVLGLSLNAKSS